MEIASQPRDAAQPSTAPVPLFPAEDLSVATETPPVAYHLVIGCGSIDPGLHAESAIATADSGTLSPSSKDDDVVQPLTAGADATTQVTAPASAACRATARIASRCESDEARGDTAIATFRWIGHTGATCGVDCRGSVGTTRPRWTIPVEIPSGASQTHTILATVDVAVPLPFCTIRVGTGAAISSSQTHQVLSAEGVGPGSLDIVVDCTSNDGLAQSKCVRGADAERHTGTGVGQSVTFMLRVAITAP